MDAEFQLNPHELTGMDQTAFLHLDNKIATVMQETQQRIDSSETRTAVQISSVRTEFAGFMQEIRGELKRLNENKDRDAGMKHYVAWSVPIVIAALQLIHDFHK